MLQPYDARDVPSMHEVSPPFDVIGFLDDASNRQTNICIKYPRLLVHGQNIISNGKCVCQESKKCIVVPDDLVMKT